MCLFALTLKYLEAEQTMIGIKQVCQWGKENHSAFIHLWRVIFFFFVNIKYLNSMCCLLLFNARQDVMLDTAATVLFISLHQ